jgi:hypothetical protein
MRCVVILLPTDATTCRTGRILSYTQLECTWDGALVLGTRNTLSTVNLTVCLFVHLCILLPPRHPHHVSLFLLALI